MILSLSCGAVNITVLQKLPISYNTPKTQLNNTKMLWKFRLPYLFLHKEHGKIFENAQKNKQITVFEISEAHKVILSNGVYFMRSAKKKLSVPSPRLIMNTIAFYGVYRTVFAGSSSCS
jgi:hypothetical protein